jgi:hypothetical protein
MRRTNSGLRKGLGSFSGGESTPMPPVFGRQGIQIIADTVPESVADGRILSSRGIS